MSALEPVSPSSGGSSNSLSSPSIPRACVAGAFESKRVLALRESIRCMEAHLVDLVFESSRPGPLMDWLRVPLECAAATGNFAAVKRLLTAGVKTKAPPERLRTAPLLHLAAESGNERVVEELLMAGVDVHEKDSYRASRTALHCAAAAGSSAVVRALTSAGARMDVLDDMGRTPLHYACLNGHRCVVVFLLLKGACAQQASREKEPPLHLAAMHDHPGVIGDLLSFGNVSIGRYDTLGRSALHVAAEYHRVDACVALLRGGAEVSLTNSKGMTCLDVAASSGHTGKLLQVLTTAEKTNDRRHMCSTALYHAACANKPHTILDLVALGADVEHCKSRQVPSLHAAVMRGADSAANALLLLGANVEARSNGNTPLHLACTHTLPNMVELLLHWGADEDAMDFEGGFPSDIINIRALCTEEDPLPEDQLLENRILSLLETAPADRIWRRRGWLVLCRARWLARIAEGEKLSSAPLKLIADCTTGAKKRRAKPPGPALVVKSRDVSLDKGKAHRRNKGEGGRLPEATAAAAAVMLRLGECSVLSEGGSGQMAGVARLYGRTGFVAIVEQLLLLREDALFRKVVTFL